MNKIETKPVYNKEEAFELISSGEKVFRYIPTGELYYSEKHDEEFQSKGQFIEICSQKELKEIKNHTIFYDNDKSFSEFNGYEKLLDTEKTESDFEKFKKEIKDELC